MTFSPEVLATLQGTPFGTDGDLRAAPPQLAVDGRTECLRVLKRYIQDLVFYRPGGVDAITGKDLPDIKFQFAADDILIGWPDYVENLNFPAIVFLPGKGSYETLNYGSVYDESTINQYKPGTVVCASAEYVEIFTMEIWAAKSPELRSIVSGLQSAFTPTETMYGLRFKVPRYFGQLVRFTIEDTQFVDSADSARNRRRAQITMEMSFQVSYLANAQELTLSMGTIVDADETAQRTIIKVDGDSYISGETDIVDPLLLERVAGDAEECQIEVAETEDICR